MDFLKALRAT